MPAPKRHVLLQVKASRIRPKRSGVAGNGAAPLARGQTPPTIEPSDTARRLGAIIGLLWPRREDRGTDTGNQPSFADTPASTAGAEAASAKSQSRDGIVTTDEV